MNVEKKTTKKARTERFSCVINSVAEIIGKKYIVLFSQL